MRDSGKQTDNKTNQHFLCLGLREPATEILTHHFEAGPKALAPYLGWARNSSKENVLQDAWSSISFVTLIYSGVSCHLTQMFYLVYSLGREFSQKKDIRKRLYVYKHIYLSLRRKLLSCVESLKETGNSFEWFSLHFRAAKGLTALAYPGGKFSHGKRTEVKKAQKIITKTLMWERNANNSQLLMSYLLEALQNLK